MINESIMWIIFGIIVAVLLALDLGVFQKKAHSTGLRKSIYLTIFYVIISLAFAGWIYLTYGTDRAYLFLTAYVVEKSLSFDNLFVFLIIFGYFKMDIKYQHRILFWGILGALITRGLFIFAGITAIKIFEPIMYAFGLFLIYTSIKVLRGIEPKVEPENNFILKHFGKYLPLKKDYIGQNFFVRECSKLYITPLLIVLIVIESTDIMFAVDSVPAVISITRDTFIVYTSNVFAILGLRALYFVIAEMMPSFQYLKYGVGIVLAFIGIKMLIKDFYEVPTGLSLEIVLGCLAISVIASLLWKKPEETKEIKSNTE